MQLNDQSIYDLCAPDGLLPHRRCAHPKTGTLLPMISPFEPSKLTIGGKSAGLSCASYDARIAHDLTLPPHPAFALRTTLRDALIETQRVVAQRRLAERQGYKIEGEPNDFDIFARYVWDVLRGDDKPNFALANTIEDFALPHDVSAQVCDKSTYARLGLSCFNTFFDPGFIGNATLELVNLSTETIVIRAGEPICQFVFNWLDRPSQRAYDGKYQFQRKAPVPARFNDIEGTGLDPET